MTVYFYTVHSTKAILISVWTICTYNLLIVWVSPNSAEDILWIAVISTYAAWEWNHLISPWRCTLHLEVSPLSWSARVQVRIGSLGFLILIDIWPPQFGFGSNLIPLFKDPANHRGLVCLPPNQIPLWSLRVFRLSSGPDIPLGAIQVLHSTFLTKNWRTLFPSIFVRIVTIFTAPSRARVSNAWMALRADLQN